MKNFRLFSPQALGISLYKIAPILILYFAGLKKVSPLPGK
jgi:hypothetical protein